MAIFTFDGKSVKKGVGGYVIYQPSLRPPYSINVTCSRIPADGAGKPLFRTAERSLQLVNLSIGSGVMSILRISSLQVLRPKSSN